MWHRAVDNMRMGRDVTQLLLEHGAPSFMTTAIVITSLEVLG
jgi:hypothetical protein